MLPRISVAEGQPIADIGSVRDTLMGRMESILGEYLMQFEIISPHFFDQQMGARLVKHLPEVDWFDSRFDSIVLHYGGAKNFYVPNLGALAPE